MCGGVTTVVNGNNSCVWWVTTVVNRNNSGLCVVGLLITVVNRSDSSLCVCVSIWYGFALCN